MFMLKHIWITVYQVSNDECYKVYFVLVVLSEFDIFFFKFL